LWLIILAGPLNGNVDNAKVSGSASVGYAVDYTPTDPGKIVYIGVRYTPTEIN